MNASVRCRWPSWSVTSPDTELDRLCRDHLVAYKIPVAFRHVHELPRSEVGKVLRRELVAMGATGERGDDVSR